MSEELGVVSILGADAVGPAGQRRFRLFASGERSSVVMWMEKEQLNSLAEALDKFLAALNEGQVETLRVIAQSGEAPQLEGMPESFPKTPTHDFQVGHMRLNYSQDDGTFLLSALPIEIIMERGQEPQVMIREEAGITIIFSQRQAQHLSRHITRLVVSGRPLCPLCRQPLDGGPHACIQQNGHRKIVEGEEGDEDE
jgi:uncharacterized repeat protein (TIGR03847 family)